MTTSDIMQMWNIDLKVQHTGRREEWIRGQQSSNVHCMQMEYSDAMQGQGIHLHWGQELVSSREADVA